MEKEKRLISETGPDPRDAVRSWLRQVRRSWDKEILSANRYDRLGKKSVSIDTRPDSPGAAGQTGIGPFHIGMRRDGARMLFTALRGDEAAVFLGDGFDNIYLLDKGEGPVRTDLAGFLGAGERITGDFCRQSREAFAARLREWAGSLGGNGACFTCAHTFTVRAAEDMFSLRMEGRKGVWEELSMEDGAFLWQGTDGYSRLTDRKELTFRKFCRKFRKLRRRAEAEHAEWLAEREFDDLF